MKYKISSLILKNIQYNFAVPNSKYMSVSIQDHIKLVEINEVQALLNVSRELCLGRDMESLIKINYEVTVESDASITKEALLEALKNNEIGLVTVFSKISLLMSHVTNLSPFGVIVTPPNYNTDKVDIT